MKISSLFASASIALIAAASPIFAKDVNKAAPSFTLKDTAGKEVSLSDLKGKIVVLEWLNYSCPFVKKHYSGGNMQKLQADATSKDVVWLSVHSAHEGHATYLAPEALGSKATEHGAKASHVLLDASGATGQAYGAKTTPHMFIIGKDGNLAYAGGIDSINSTEASDVEKAEPLFKNALMSVIDGKAPAQQSTAPYGCSVKYKE